MREPSKKVWQSNNYLVLDFETTNLDKGNPSNPANDIILACWALGPGHPSYSPDKELYSKWGGKYEQQELLCHVKEADYIVAHNAKFELKWLAQAGLPMEDVLAFCTMIAEYVTLGNQKKPLGLDAVCKRYRLPTKDSVVSILIKGGVCPSQIPRSLLEKYCKKDVAIGLALFLLLRSKITRMGLSGCMLTRSIVTPLLAELELTGLYLPKTSGPGELPPALEKMSRLSLQLNELTGGINHNSPKQVGEYLYDTLEFEELTDHKGNPVRTKADNRKTGTEIIQQLKATTDEQKQFKELIQQVIALDDEIDFLTKVENCQQDAGGILLANINQCVTATHRFSSSGQFYKMQFQNIARRRKRYFGPRYIRGVDGGGCESTSRSSADEWSILEADGSQLEFRVAAHMGRDKQALEDIAGGFDVHTFGASVLGVTRQEAKAHTFKPLYGGQSGPKWLRDYYKAFRERYPGIGGTQKGWTYEVLKDKKLQIETGITFHWPDCKMYQSGWIQHTPSIYNYPIQSMATADIIPIAITYMWQRAKRMGLKSFITNTVHDSVIIELYNPEKEVLTRTAVESFTRDVYYYLKQVYNIDFLASLGVGVKVGPRWSEGEERKFDVSPEGVEIER
jgi:DNA polymerase I-like protein with 3'-5' exonuclease and polymerase domains